jgi:glycosidase
MKKLFFFLLITSISFAQIDRVEPPFWWSGMNHSNIVLLFHGKNLQDYSITSTDVSILNNTHYGYNKDYCFVEINTTSVEPKDVVFTFTNYSNKNDTFTHTYTLKKRIENSGKRKGFDSKDVLYLIMPDRFSNGNPANDSTPDTQEKANRSLPGGRHGGDIQGIINHLDYLQELGITTIWNTPLCEDNDKEYSYHGYAQSNIYKIDSRYGTNEDYLKLSDELHKRKMKLIIDYVPNHWGLEHWIYKDKPMNDWFHQFPEFTQTNYRMTTQFDENTSPSDKAKFTDGWFVPTMPDLNQDNPVVLQYLIQNAIWWIEYANLDGMRVDTYTYNSKDAIAKWTKEIMQEYPNFNIVGEVWYHNTAQNAYWQRNTYLGRRQNYNSGLPSVMDFTLHDAINEGVFNETKPEWNKGLIKLYDNFVNDFLYSNPNDVLTFLENHDTTRFNHIYPNIQDYKLGLALIATTRGIPQLYYGSEIGMQGNKNLGDADIRKDFPGGWQEDTKNAFTKDGRTTEQNEYFEYTKKLLNWRKNSNIYEYPNLRHYVPENNVYVYFVYNPHCYQWIMVLLNNNIENQKINLNRFKDIYNLENTNPTDIISDKKIKLTDSIEIPGKTAMILDFTTIKTTSKKKK